MSRAVSSIPVAMADEEQTRRFTEHLIRAFEAYVSEHEPRQLDAIMALHNLHRAVVIDMAERNGLQGRNLRLFLTMVDDTFHQAMEEAG